jgi:hypothetical protein
MSGVRDLDLFSATGSSSLLPGLGGRQVGERRIRLRGHLRGYWSPRRRGHGGCSSRSKLRTGGISAGRWLWGRHSRARLQLQLYDARRPDDIKDIVIQVGKSKIFKR